ncbi:MamI family restriction endonuclease [Hoylesella timonensis]|uniref:MamI restriction endonuclease n=1 Tax=Hoylesella timonensis CRIS 5C-B1 TaxID=679189 RepID=D1W182_9BACT|nr:MamI family restriction endonuclease [Hoylesella timonensis]EFA96888.1 MamI restriction endonuclease [Hoylesella timonensis CRIS 5C-B1]
MTPQKNRIKINDNLYNLYKFIDEIIVSPKHLLKKWSLITNQTPAAKLGYIGQHLASLITGVPGTGSGARGDDLSDGSEVKSCNKVDQADKCKKCGARVMRYEESCPNCNSTDILRKDDSKWLFTVRSQAELEQYLNMDRIILILMDYPNFVNRDYKDIRILCFEIYPKEDRGKVFCDLISNHYNNIYLPKLTANLKTNPMNLHPWSYQFYKCNPIKIFECTVKDIDTNPQIQIDMKHYIKPSQERDARFPVVPMPTSLLKVEEWDELLAKANYDTEIAPLLSDPITSIVAFKKLSKKKKEESLPYLSEKLRNYLSLRKIVSVVQKSRYSRSEDRKG